MNLEWLGLGIALTKINFTVVVYRSPHSYGFGVRKYIHFNKCTEEQKKCIEVWAQANGFSTTEKQWIQGETLNKVLDILEPFYSLLNQQQLNGIAKIRWMQNNPMPKVLWKDDGTRYKQKKGKNWKKFMYWVEAWDAFCEGLE